MSIRAVTRSSPLLSSMVSHQQHHKADLQLSIENLTSEQYTGVMPRQINALSVSKDTLNPLLNTTILKQRLSAIEYYNTLHGV